MAPQRPLVERDHVGATFQPRWEQYSRLESRSHRNAVFHVNWYDVKKTPKSAPPLTAERPFPSPILSASCKELIVLQNDHMISPYFLHIRLLNLTLYWHEDPCSGRENGRAGRESRR